MSDYISEDYTREAVETAWFRLLARCEKLELTHGGVMLLFLTDVELRALVPMLEAGPDVAVTRTLLVEFRDILESLDKENG